MKKVTMKAVKIHPSMSHFFKEIKRIGLNDYMPSKMDIQFAAECQHTGISQTTIIRDEPMYFFLSYFDMC